MHIYIYTHYSILYNTTHIIIYYRSVATSALKASALQRQITPAGTCGSWGGVRMDTYIYIYIYMYTYTYMYIHACK